MRDSIAVGTGDAQVHHDRQVVAGSAEEVARRGGEAADVEHLRVADHLRHRARASHENVVVQIDAAFAAQVERGACAAGAVYRRGGERQLAELRLRSPATMRSFSPGRAAAIAAKTWSRCATSRATSAASPSAQVAR